MSLSSLIYISSAIRPFSKEDLTALLETSRRNNTREGITGMLVYKGGNFMQAIEGDSEVVDKLHDKIRRDSRHCGLVTLVHRPIEQRQFPDWSMGFRDLADPELRKIVGYHEFLNTPLNVKEFSDTPSVAQKLLLSFKQKM